MRWYERLRRQSEIAHVRRRGRRAATSTMTAYALELPLLTCSRVGVTVSKSVGKAVVRNLVRRRLRGALDGMGPVVSAKTVLLLVARPEAAEASYERLASDLAYLMKSLEPSQRRGV